MFKLICMSLFVFMCLGSVLYTTYDKYVKSDISECNKTSNCTKIDETSKNLDAIDIVLPKIMTYENFNPHVYKNSKGLESQGYGHLCYNDNKCTPGVPWLKGKASHILNEDVKVFENYVDQYVKVALDKFQKAALILLTYDIGPVPFRDSQLLKNLNNQDYNQAAQEFESFNNVGGVEVSELTERRRAEKILFCKNGGCLLVK